MIDITKLRWTMGERDVTCANCHTAIYNPEPDEIWCPTCRAAAGEDILSVQTKLQDKARRALTQ